MAVAYDSANAYDSAIFYDGVAVVPNVRATSLPALTRYTSASTVTSPHTSAATVGNTTSHPEVNP